MTRYRFLDFELDTDAFEFRSAGVVQRLEPQVFDLLCHLVEHSNRLISRDELIERVWGGRIVSEAAIASRINAARKAVRDDGKSQNVIVTIPRRGIRFVVPVVRDDDTSISPRADAPGCSPAAAGEPPSDQQVRICRSGDGTKIAFATFGAGPPVVRVGHWLTHLEHDWRSPIWRPFLGALGEKFTVVRYDQRGNGLSDRAVEDLSLDAMVADLEAVVDTAGLDCFPLYATSQGVPVGLEYVTRHPGRVTRLVLHGGYHRGRLLRSQQDRAQGEAILALMEHGWAAEGSHFLQAFGSLFIPDGTPEQIRSLVELQKITVAAETAARLRRAFDSLDVTDRLAAITTPTLVVHGRNDGVHPIEQSLHMAATMPRCGAGRARDPQSRHAEA
jgi:DNA-binding winged helix-turn-helix (wHTH) protein/pimeloyl-ACP methyl ester carboxylesterase